MIDFRPTIQARMKELGITSHGLARLCGWTPKGGVPSPTTIRDYLNGREIRSANLAVICGALGLELRPTGGAVGNRKGS